MEGFNLFNKIGRNNMMHICEILDMKYVNKGEVIEFISENKEKVYFLKNGTVKIVNRDSDIAKYIVNKGNIFGELVLYDQEAANEQQAVALDDCVICSIEANQMTDLMNQHESLKNEIFKVYGLRIKKLERRLQDLLYKDSGTRIKEFILDYILDFGKSNNDRIIAKNLLSHKDIAHLTNTSRQTVSNAMSTLRKNKIIDYNSQYISINKK
ncbi:CRP/FNR family transcriptional regulator, anaerobic regulatory protein [Aquimarina amphilecti]|uniref:CRP/FNR family transcriptional regulator, anaerobic regulatory protein n=2 Tax=Aquimarina amphilecti TaxID=1038014 RepID=A0A1H7SH70_AQUAM|nr:CRP/FNR family transcriptional regulator, anaerobic regulatory protein [Aquimarina amphilecti]